MAARGTEAARGAVPEAETADWVREQDSKASPPERAAFAAKRSRGGALDKASTERAGGPVCVPPGKKPGRSA